MINEVVMKKSEPSSKLFETDSRAYDVIKNAVIESRYNKGLVCEIGTRRAGSTKIIIDSLLSIDQSDKMMICIDPYGNIPYAERDNKKMTHDYTNIMRNETIPHLYSYAYEKLLNFQFFNMEDTEFFKRFADGVPFYTKGNKEVVNNYSFVFFDGPHDYEGVLNEVLFFLPRTSVGSTFVFDDTYDNRYDHDKIEKDFLFPNGWEKMEDIKPKKSYIKKQHV